MSRTMHTTTEGELVGEKMHAAMSIVQTYGPQPSMNALAKRVGPHGSQKYGYRIVNRCRHKGLLDLDSDHDKATPQGRGAVVLTEKGRRYLNRHD